MTDRPAVLFVCVHNAGRSQMAAALLQHHTRGFIDVMSAGTLPAEDINPSVVAVMAEIGIDLGEAAPRHLADSDVKTADVVVTMGCGDACPYYPGKRYLDWKLDDPAGLPPEAVRPIRDEIERLVLELVGDLTRRM